MSSTTRTTILSEVASAPAAGISGKVLWQSIFRWRDLSKAPLHDFPIRDEILRQFMSFFGDMSVLEIGPGSGFTAFWLSPLLAGMMVVDVMPEVIADLRQQLQAVPNLSFASANLAGNELPSRVDRQFDAAFALDVFEYVAEPAAALRNLAEILRPGGQLFLTFPNVMPPVGDGITFFRSPQEIEALLESAGFRSWQIFSVRKREFARVTYRLLHEWPLALMRALRTTNTAERPQTYEGTWAFKKRQQLTRTKFALHLYWICLGYILWLGGPVFEPEPASNDLLGRQLIIRAWK
jgi:SAM-dependent methyltransferase